MIIDCIADLHGHYPKLEGGDLLIVAGDLTASGRFREFYNFAKWINDQDYKKKIVIAGNHDKMIQERGWEEIPIHFDYLCDSGTKFEGLKIWGSPWTLTFPGINPHCTAFTGTEEELEAKFKLIPDDTDILITHGPPYDYLDHIKNEYGERTGAGSESLYERIMEGYPMFHVFGHIHEGYGVEERDFFPVYGRKQVKFINCSHVNEFYKPINKPIRIEI